MKNSALLLCGGIVCSFLGQVALGDDLHVPDWRGMDGSTWAAWEFSTDNPSPAPDQGQNNYGSPDLDVLVGIGQSWLETWDGRQGVWPLSGAIRAGIPNRPEQLPEKWIQVQLTWQPQVEGSRPFVFEATGLNADVSLRFEHPIHDTWTHSVYDIHIVPNPDFEIIRIEGGIVVDELVVDTFCTPEPGTLMLLALGAAVLRRRK